MSRHGWTYIKKFHDIHGEFVYSFESKPEMCTEDAINACKTAECAVGRANKLLNNDAEKREF